MRIKVVNWKKFNPRKDVVNSSWFRLEHKTLSMPEFWSLTDAEFRAWIYILSVCSMKNSDTIDLLQDHASRVCNVNWKAILTLVEKLKGEQILTVDVTDTSRGRHADVTFTNATLRDVTNDTVCERAKILRSTSSPEEIKTNQPKLWLRWKERYASEELIGLEIRRANEWLEANGKVMKNYGAFYSTWLSRSHDLAAASKTPEKPPLVAFEEPPISEPIDLTNKDALRELMEKL